jgi:hypothetical protein
LPCQLWEWRSWLSLAPAAGGDASGGRQIEPEKRAASGRRSDGEITPHRPRKSARDVKAETRSGVSPSVIAAAEAFTLVEDPLRLLGGDAGAFVGNGYSDAGALLPYRIDA